MLGYYFSVLSGYFGAATPAGGVERTSPAVVPYNPLEHLGPYQVTSLPQLRRLGPYQELARRSGANSSTQSSYSSTQSSISYMRRSGPYSKSPGPKKYLALI